VVLVEAAVGALERVAGGLERLQRSRLGEGAQRAAEGVEDRLDVAASLLYRELGSGALRLARSRVARECGRQRHRQELGEGPVELEKLAVDAVELRLNPVVGVSSGWGLGADSRDDAGRDQQQDAGSDDQEV